MNLGWMEILVVATLVNSNFCSHILFLQTNGSKVFAKKFSSLSTCTKIWAKVEVVYLVTSCLKNIGCSQQRNLHP